MTGLFVYYFKTQPPERKGRNFMTILLDGCIYMKITQFPNQFLNTGIVELNFGVFSLSFDNR